MQAEDKYDAVLEEVPRVRKDFGEPPLVTPSSQIVGTQAVLNVVLGERYKSLTKESKDLLLGKYGKTVKPFNPEVQKKAMEMTGEEPITCRFADTLEPELDKLESEMKQWNSRMKTYFHMHYFHRLQQSSSNTEKLSRIRLILQQQKTEHIRYKIS